MTSFLKKDSLIYRYMNKYRTKNNIIILIVAALLTGYFAVFGPYITNVFFGSVPLDGNSFKAQAQLVCPGVSEAPDDESIKSSVLKGDSYWQGDKYEFDIRLTDIEYTGIDYTTKNTSESFNPETSEPLRSAMLYMAGIEGVPVLVLAYPHTELTEGAAVSGIFAPVAPIIAWDIQNSAEYNGREIFPYILDTRGLTMESEPFDVFIFAALCVILLFLIIKNIVYYINPLTTPTYRSLAKYGKTEETVADVEAQLKAKGIDRVQKNNPVYTEDWIVSRDVFKLLVQKNHAKPQDSSRYGSRL